MATLTVNGVERRYDGEPEMPLLWFLRDELGLTGTKFGCGQALCGACTVHVDGAAIRSCVLPVAQAAGKRVVTLEGLGTPENPHKLQSAFIQEQAVQCGYCTNGMIMEGADLLERNPRPSAEQVKEAMANNICRCGTHPRVVAAVLRAAQG